MIDFKGPREDLKDNPPDGINDYVSFVDTKFLIDVDFSSNFATYSGEDVQIFSRSSTELETEVSDVISVEAYLCDDTKARYTEEIEFTEGQDFRICVNVIEEESVYVPSKFVEVTCSNNAEERFIVVDEAPDVLTSVDSQANNEGVLSFQSTVTSNFLEENEGSFGCNGVLDISIRDSGSSTGNDNNQNIERLRRLDEQPDGARNDVALTFGTTIKLSKDASSSSSPRPTYNSWINTVSLSFWSVCIAVMVALGS